MTSREGAPGASGPSTIAERSLSDLASNPGLPLPARTRIVKELVDDLGGLPRRLVAEGRSPDEAGRRAAEVVLPAGPALQELEELARPRYHRLLAGFEARRVRAAERAALAVATLLMLGLAGGTLLRTGLLTAPSPYLWPVLGVGTTTLATILAKAFKLWIKGAHHRPRRGLRGIAVLAALTLGLGCAGALLDLVSLAGTLETTPTEGAELLTAWLVREAALVSTAIIFALSGALGWLALHAWITWVEQAHAEALDLTPSPTMESK